MSPTITLTLPVAGTNVGAGLHATNYAAIQALVNGTLDNTNIAALAAIAKSKIKATGAFSAYKSANQTGIVTATNTKVTFNTKEFDVDSWFDSTTNSRYTPLVAGYYRLNVQVYWVTLPVSTNGILMIYKNGAEHKRLDLSIAPEGGALSVGGTVNVQANGSTDYFEVYVFQNSGSNKDLTGGVSATYFQGELIGTS